MVYEAVKIELTNDTGFPRRYTCADGTAIVKNTLLKLTDPRTASASDTDGAKFAGIAAMDKEASDGSTSITAYTSGVFDLVASGVILVGDPVCLDAAKNCVRQVVSGTAGASGASIVGYALETASNAEVINVRISC